MLKQRSSLVTMLSCLTGLSLCAQIVFFFIHSQVSSLIDNLIDSSLSLNLFHPIVLLPIIEFILLQVLAYLFFIAFIWFLAVNCSRFFRSSAYYLGLVFWALATLALFSLNRFYFPNSFFADLLLGENLNRILLGLSLGFLGLAAAIAYYQLFRYRQERLLGSVFLSLAALLLLTSFYNQFAATTLYKEPKAQSQPNIIIIGLDSLRPDFTSYYGNASTKTPTIDQFLNTAVRFKETYTPLARTFPAWVSILTAKHPKNSHARINLNSVELVLENETLAKRLQAAGYETIYATDEKRFSNITRDFGFDQVIGPRMGLSDFILGGLSDFPLTNLLINLPIGRYIFPFNYGNRAAAITYEPDSFLQMIKVSLHQRQAKPLFLTIHFCLSHWPFTWAQDKQLPKFLMNQRYQSAVQQVDLQFAKTLTLLKESGLLQNSIVILLSDHGTSFGLSGDRMVEKKNYRGDPAKLAFMTVSKLNTVSDTDLDLKNHYVLNTAYGQGTEVLSLKQYQVLLAIQAFGAPFLPHTVNSRSSLLDVAPTILDFLKLPPLKAVEGRSLLADLKGASAGRQERALYLETGHSVAEIERDKIDVAGAIKHSIKLYQLNPQTGYLSVKRSAEKAVLQTKQRALLLGPWILARYPASIRKTLVPSKVQKNNLVYKEYRLAAYYVLANLETGEWTIGFDSAFAKKAPLAELQKKFKDFYGAELH